MNRKFSRLVLLILTLGSIAFFWINGNNPIDLLMAFWWPLLTVLEFSLLLSFFTALSPGDLMFTFAIGLTVTPLLTYVIQKPLNMLLEGSAVQHFLAGNDIFGTTALQAPLIAPITEELLKLLPILIFLLLLLPLKKHRLLSPVDYALLGVTAGAGFDIFENLCRIQSGFFDYFIGLYRSPINEVAGKLGWLIMPGMIKSEYLGNPSIWFSHAGLTGVMALAIGWAFYLGKKRYTVLPLLVYLAAIVDHSMWNWYYPGASPLWVKIIPKLTWNGRLLPALFWCGLLAGIYVVVKHKRLFSAELKRVSWPAGGSSSLLVRIAMYLRALRRDNQLSNAFRFYLKKGIKSEPFDYVVADLAGQAVLPMCAADFSHGAKGNDEANTSEDLVDE